MKLLLAEEIELDHWVWKSLESLATGVNGELEESAETKFFVRKSNAGAERFECLRPDYDLMNALYVFCVNKKLETHRLR